MIALPPEVEILVQHQVESGKYGSIEEALLAGMHLLEQRQQEEEEDIAIAPTIQTPPSAKPTPQNPPSLPHRSHFREGGLGGRR
jgi:hypothetical protein